MGSGVGSGAAELADAEGGAEGGQAGPGSGGQGNDRECALEAAEDEVGRLDVVARPGHEHAGKAQHGEPRRGPEDDFGGAEVDQDSIDSRRNRLPDQEAFNQRIRQLGIVYNGARIALSERGRGDA